MWCTLYACAYAVPGCVCVDHGGAHQILYHRSSAQRSRTIPAQPPKYRPSAEHLAFRTGVSLSITLGRPLSSQQRSTGCIFFFVSGILKFNIKPSGRQLWGCGGSRRYSKRMRVSRGLQRSPDTTEVDVTFRTRRKKGRCSITLTVFPSLCSGYSSSPSTLLGGRMYGSPAKLLSRSKPIYCCCGVCPLVAESHVSRAPHRWPQVPMNVGILSQGTEINASLIIIAMAICMTDIGRTWPTLIISRLSHPWVTELIELPWSDPVGALIFWQHKPIFVQHHCVRVPSLTSDSAQTGKCMVCIASFST